MIWIDFGIICIGQEKITVPPDKTDLRFEGCPRPAGSKPFYNDHYHFHTADQLSGCWYNVWLPDSICYEESFFDISPRGVPYLETVPKWATDVEDVLRFYLNESPVHKIAVLLRIEDRSNDTVHPDCGLEDFMQGLTEGRIRWNELYFIKNQGLSENRKDIQQGGPKE